MGRMCTVTRFSVKKVISHVVCRYDIFKQKLFGNMIAESGMILKYIKNTHVYFKIGKLSSNLNRLYVYLLMLMNLNKHPLKHPIPQPYFNSAIVNTNPPITDFELIDYNNIKNVMKDKCSQFYLNDHELILKGGIGNYMKCLNSLWQKSAYNKSIFWVWIF